MNDEELAGFIADDLKGLWPTGSVVIEGRKYAWQDSRKETAARLLAFKRKYECRITRRIVKEAALAYLKDCGGTPRQLLRYFIFKDKKGAVGIEYTSSLLTYMEAIESEEDEFYEPKKDNKMISIKPDITKLGVIQSDELYFSNPAYGHSTLCRFERDGFKALKHLYDPLDSPSILFGHMVDCMLTEGMKAFHDQFHMQQFAYTKDSDQYRIAEKLSVAFPDVEWENVPDESKLAARIELDAWKNLKVEDTILRKINENCSKIFDDIKDSKGKVSCTWEDYNDAKACVDAVLNEPSTAFFFKGDDKIERHFQLQFFEEFNGVPVKCKPDMLLVDHENKRVTIGDLKTTSFPEYEFYKPFVNFGYMTQANMYTRIIRKRMDSDPVFKEYKINPFFFVPVNRETLTPILFHTDMNHKEGDFQIGKIKFRDPFTVAKELHDYECQKGIKVPTYINEHKRNSLDSLIEKFM